MTNPEMLFYEKHAKHSRHTNRGKDDRGDTGIARSISVIFVIATFLFGMAYLLVLVSISLLGRGSFSQKDPFVKYSPAAEELIRRAREGIDPRRFIDYHMHPLGLGTAHSGLRIHPSYLNFMRFPLRAIKFSIYMNAAGITDLKRADAQYMERMVSLAASSQLYGRGYLLAMDDYYDKKGRRFPQRTEVYVPNDYTFRQAAARPDLFAPAISVHPYRRDAPQILEKWARRGVRLVKWLPNSMNIDPADPRCDASYRVMKRYGMTLIVHTGEEYAVAAAGMQELGNPLRLRRALDAGVRVLAAHCASLGTSRDLDRPGNPRALSFDLFLRMMGNKRYRGLLYGEISALTHGNRLNGPLATILRRKDLHSSLRNGSDYPLPAVNIVIRTSEAALRGYITMKERRALAEIFHANPLLFDFVFKRTLRDPTTKSSFSPEIFMLDEAVGI